MGKKVSDLELAAVWRQLFENNQLSLDPENPVDNKLVQASQLKFWSTALISTISAGTAGFIFYVGRVQAKVPYKTLALRMTYLTIGSGLGFLSSPGARLYDMELISYSKANREKLEAKIEEYQRRADILKDYRN